LPIFRGESARAQMTGPSSTMKAREARAPFRIESEFDDNRLLTDLLGEFDAHLSLIESRLQVHAVAHGNVVVLEGPKDSCLLAKAVLDSLYKRLKAGMSVTAGDVEGALRHIQRKGAEISEPDAGNGASSPQQSEVRTRRRSIIARTPTQSAYIKALAKHDLVFATGPAGTGKTYLAVAYAAACLERGEIERVILSRPAVEAGERLGFLPGDMKEKVDPYLRPLYDALYDVLPPERVERGFETHAIEIAPLAFMRGRTLSHAIVILDEAQNCTPMQMKMFLTRLGEGSKMVVTGDPSQVDLPFGQSSGLSDALSILRNVAGIAHIVFSSADVVRHPLVGRIVEAYESRG
jgi:phosphate starvation-inducible PhoH-like protein